MPGVPWGRGCDACRKQKKKCSQETPSCSRCIRLRIICTGSGQQRYQFKGDRCFRTNTNKGRKTSNHLLERDALVNVPRAPTNALTLLVDSFVGTIKLSTSLRYNLAWAYGGFLEDIPKRLGNNEALDTAVGAIILGHWSLCSREEPGIKVISQYSCALQKVREYLDDPIKARTSETLCAVVLLSIFQSFIGSNDKHTVSHSEGAAQILKFRRFYNIDDEFECKLLLSLRGSVLVAGIFNPKINLTRAEWKTVVENKLDGSTPEGQMMRSLAQFPDIMDRGRKARREGTEDLDLLEEARSNYRVVTAIITALHSRYIAVQSPKDDEPAIVTPLQMVYAQYQRIYGLGLSIGIMLNCVLRALDDSDATLFSESRHFSEELLELSDSASIYRPFGAAYIPLCLTIAWVGTTDRTIRVLVEKKLSDYQDDFPYNRTLSSPASLEKTFQHLHLN